MSATADQLASTLEDALSLLNDASYPIPVVRDDVPEGGTLLEQCLAMCAAPHSRRTEPVRTLHHFACTGGTLISKCIASMPNVQLISEVDPLSPSNADRPRFAPTDMITLMRQSTHGADSGLLVEIFLSALGVIHSHTARAGQRLVLRDHAHGQFCTGGSVSERPTLREIVGRILPTLSVLTVRHPLDSMESLRQKSWLHFDPATVDEYCRRYLAFLDRHADLCIIRYEDFVTAPEARMRELCEVLELRFTPDFVDLFGVHRLTGDSGRSGDQIALRPSRPAVRKLLAEAQASANYLQLVERLSYPAHPPGLAP